MANNFVKFKGKEVGKSLLEKGSDKIIKDIYEHANICNCEILTPVDFSVSETKRVIQNSESSMKLSKMKLY